jgi:hypothetical protein
MRRSGLGAPQWRIHHTGNVGVEFAEMRTIPSILMHMDQEFH